DLDVIEGIDEEGNQILLQVMDYFFYNGEEYVILADADDSLYSDCDDEECEHDHEQDELDLYIMKVITSTGDDGEEMEEFVPVDEELMDTLIEVVQTNFAQEESAEE
ncbi:MAG: DUF1292 domain-containing protein, partial [Clostridiales bacterium]|nr:DUF1292 domain-containing protein [Clostridiales bacterium]